MFGYGTFGELTFAQGPTVAGTPPAPTVKIVLINNPTLSTNVNDPSRVS